MHYQLRDKIHVIMDKNKRSLNSTSLLICYYLHIIREVHAPLSDIEVELNGPEAEGPLVPGCLRFASAERYAVPAIFPIWRHKVPAPSTSP